MASWLIRIVSSPGKSSRRRWEICCGLHALAQRRCFRGPCRRPFQCTAVRESRPLPGLRRCRPTGPEHTSAAPCWWPASPASGAVQPARHATGRWWHDTPGRRRASPRYAAVLARSSMPLAPAGGRSRAPPGPAPCRARSPRAPRTTDTVRTAPSTMPQASMVACRPPPGTSEILLAAIPPRRSPLPRSTSPPRSTSRSAAAHRAVPPLVGQANAICPAGLCLNAASQPSSQPPLSRCCDDRLKPPGDPPSEWWMWRPGALEGLTGTRRALRGGAAPASPRPAPTRSRAGGPRPPATSSPASPVPANRPPTQATSPTLAEPRISTPNRRLSSFAALKLNA